MSTQTTDVSSLRQLLSFSPNEVSSEIIISADDVGRLTLSEEIDQQIADLDSSSSNGVWSPDSGYNEGDHSPRPSTSGPSLVVVEEPESSYRFRYKKESPKPHGPIKGRLSIGKTPKKSNGPRVKLDNFEGEGIIRVWLHCESESQGPSPNCLVWVDKKAVKYEPHDIVINNANNYTASFDKLNILHVVVNEEEYQKRYVRKKRSLGRPGSVLIRDPPEVDKVDQDKVKNEWRLGVKDICTLRFEAYEKRGNQYVFVGSILSKPIKNKKSPKTNDLRIVKSSHVEGTCLGGTEIMIFTEKLIKDIRIIFGDDEGWQADADFKETDIHKQVGVAFRTPPYKSQDITEGKIVWFKIHRNSDHQESEKYQFRYLPREENLSYLLEQPIKRKRPEILRRDPMMSDVLDEFISMDASDINIDDLLNVEADVNTDDLLTDAVIDLGPYMSNDSSTTQNTCVTADPTKEAPSLAERARRLLISIVQSDSAAFSQLMKTPSIANYKYAKQSPLHLAVKHQKPQMVSELLKAGANVYELGNAGSNTALHLAIQSSSRACLELLLRAAKPQPVFNEDGDDPVLFATRNGCRGALELLLIKGFFATTQNVKNGDTPLHVAVDRYLSSRQPDIIDLLLEYGASASEYNYAGKTPLHLAVAAQDDKLVEKLIRYSDADDYEDDEDELTSQMQLLELTDNQSIKANLESFLRPIDAEEKPDNPDSTEEPFLALDGDVDLSKKVAARLGCAFMTPFLVNTEKQSQVLLNYLQTKNHLTTAVDLLNDAIAKESSGQ